MFSRAKQGRSKEEGGEKDEEISMRHKICVTTIRTHAQIDTAPVHLYDKCTCGEEAEDISTVLHATRG